jgi:cephalosporin-C deacetylase
MAGLTINVDSHDKLPSDPCIPRDYRTVGNNDREEWYFLNMYLRDSRALDYLLIRSDWDGKTIVVMGGSMGGQQSLVLAGLRPEEIYLGPGLRARGRGYQRRPARPQGWLSQLAVG